MSDRGNKGNLQESEFVKTETEVKSERELLLYNDDVNTFDHVIDSLVDVCGHDQIQAEQCSIIVHYNGRCSVKVGEYEILNPLREALIDRGLSSTIE